MKAAPVAQRQPAVPVLVDCLWHPEVRPADFSCSPAATATAAWRPLPLDQLGRQLGYGDEASTG
ncbi:hypothetical protein ACRAWF_19795 [Streptomyces sp. L7]